jgi:hypothetical protein
MDSPTTGGDRRESAACRFGAGPVSRWRCAIGWAVYLVIAILVVVFAGAVAS